jgi:hypothetical protein
MMELVSLSWRWQDFDFTGVPGDTTIYWGIEGNAALGSSLHPTVTAACRCLGASSHQWNSPM